MLYPAELRARPRGKSSYYKGNPASTASLQDPLFTPKKAVVCTGFTVLSLLLLESVRSIIPFRAEMGHLRVPFHIIPTNNKGGSSRNLPERRNARIPAPTPP